jgi:predicted dehydrogenase
VERASMASTTATPQTPTTSQVEGDGASSTSNSSIKAIGVGIIGAGRMGRIHASTLARGMIPDARLVAVCDVLEEPARRMAAEFGVSNVFTDYLRLVENREVEAVVIATPSVMKPQIVKFACEIGKHVFCEAPIAPALHDAEQVMKSSQRSPAKFQVGYQRRSDPLYLALKEKVDSDSVGPPVLVKATTREPIPNPAEWPDLRGSGGIFFETCSHDYDLVRWLCMSEVSRVEAEGSTRSQPDQHTVITNLYLANGMVAQVDASRMSSYGYDVRAEVMGTKGVVLTRQEVRSDLRVIVKGGGEPAKKMHAGYAERFGEAYRLELGAFVRSIVRDEETIATAVDGRAAVEIAAAAKKSMQEGKAVNLPL